MNSQQKAEYKLILLTAVGTMLEWAEYTFYGYMALKLSDLFFPNNDQLLATIKTYSIFAVGYVMRPLGALIFGNIGDRFGRKPALIGSMLLMGAATFLIGCLPTYATLGMMAPVILLLLRMIQGIAVSGEFHGAGIYLIEKIGEKRPCLAGCWVSSAAAFGMILGGLAAFLVTLPQAPSYAWRIPFLFGGICCLVALYFRSCMTESQIFLQAKQTSSPKASRLPSNWYKHMKPMLSVAAMAAFTGIYVYILNIYVVAFLIQTIGLPSYHATFFAMFGETIVCLSIPLMAWIADRYHAERQYVLSLILIAISTPLLFLLLLTKNYYLIALAMIYYGLLNGMMCGPLFYLMVKQFPITSRYKEISFSWSVSAALFSGTAPLMAHYLLNQKQWLLGPAGYVSISAMVSIAVFWLTRTKQPLETVLMKQRIA